MLILIDEAVCEAAAAAAVLVDIAMDIVDIEDISIATDEGSVVYL